MPERAKIGSALAAGFYSRLECYAKTISLYNYVRKWRLGMKVGFLSGIILLLLLAALPALGKDKAGNDVHATVVYDDVATEIKRSRSALDHHR